MKNQREKSDASKAKTCVVKRRIAKLAIPLAYLFETLGAVGAGVVAAMVSPLLIH